jgi:hypothetical protein
MKNLILITYLSMISISTFSQSNYEDVVYLKNGSVIHGIIIEQIPNESIKIKSGQNIFVFQMSEIQKLTKEELKNADSQINQPTNNNSPNDELVKDILSKLVTNESNGLVKLNKYTRVDGSNNDALFKIYTVFFNITIQPTTGIIKKKSISSNQSSDVVFWNTFENVVTDFDGFLQDYDKSTIKKYPSYATIDLKGSIDFQKYENGWKAVQYTITDEKYIEKSDLQIYNEADAEYKISNILLTAQENKSYFFQVRNYNIAGYYLEFKPIVNNCNACTEEDFKLISSAIIEEFTKEKRYKTSTESIYKSNNFNEAVQFYVDDIQYQQLYTNSGNYDYNAMVKLHFVNLANGQVVDNFPLTYKGGTPLVIDTKEMALIKARKQILNSNLSYQYWTSFNPLRCWVTGVKEENDNSVSKIYIENGDIIDDKTDQYFIIVRETDMIKFGEYKKITAKSKIVEIENQKGVLKIINGNEDLKKAFNNGDKLIAISTSKEQFDKYKVK